MHPVDFDAIEQQLEDDAAEREELLEQVMPWLRLLAEVRAGAAGAWKADAACAGTDTDVFFVAKGDTLDPAREMCDRCPVIEPCTAWALELGAQQVGFVAGMTPAERARLRSIDRAA